MTEGREIPLHFTQTGNGANALVFFHGFLDDGSFWRSTIEVLEARNLSVVTLDFPAWEMPLTTRDRSRWTGSYRRWLLSSTRSAVLRCWSVTAWARVIFGAQFAPSGHALPPLECECPELMHLNPHLFEAFTYAFQGDVLYDCGQRFRIEGKQYRIKGKGVACKVIYLGTL